MNAPASRTYDHCRAWVAAGHQVTVVSCVPHHPMGKVFPGYRNRLVQREVRDGIQAVKVLTYVTANEGFVKRTCNYVFYMLMAIAVAPFLPRADVVISTSPQFFNGLAGYFVSRLKRCPWVLEVRDLWPESIVAVGALTNPRAIRALQAMERFAYRKADHIVPVTRPFAVHIENVTKRSGSPATSPVDNQAISVIPNGVDLRLFTDRAPNEAYAARAGIAGKFVASYVGTHGMAHGLDTLLDAAELLRDRSDIVFVMAGDGAERQRLQAAIRARTLDNVKMLGQLPKEEMPDLWSCSGASLVLLKKQDLFTTVIPSKIFESMAMKKPIILGVRGEAQRIITESGSGICIEPQNAGDLAAAVRRLADDPALRQRLGNAGYDYVRTNYDRSVLAAQYEALLRETSVNRRKQRSGAGA
ncbi:MAG: glycosyltransferase family 4 protein [Pseudomonadales bacterium]